MILFLFIMRLAAVPSERAVSSAEIESAVKARTHAYAGELVRVDTAQRVMTLKTDERPVREFDVAVEEGTRIVAGGRSLRLEDLRVGERVSVVCRDAHDRRHVAQSIKVRSRVH